MIDNGKVLSASCSLEGDKITIRLGQHEVTLREWENVEHAVSLLIDHATDFARHRLLLAIGRAKLEGVGG